MAEMREIKFRAWDKIRKEMIEIHNLYWFEENCVRFNGDGGAEILQFTGLKDKNGKEIYEGDVVQIYNGKNIELPPFEVIFEYNSYSMYNKDRNLHLVCFDVCEVIGNKFENPEMLK